MYVHGRNHHVFCVIKLTELCNLRFSEPTVMDGLTGWDVIQPSENFFLEKPASSNLNVENIPENGDIRTIPPNGWKTSTTLHDITSQTTVLLKNKNCLFRL